MARRSAGPARGGAVRPEYAVHSAVGQRPGAVDRRRVALRRCRSDRPAVAPAGPPGGPAALGRWAAFGRHGRVRCGTRPCRPGLGAATYQRHQRLADAHARSPVHGGKSIKRKSSSPQAASRIIWFKAFEAIGPRQTTA